MPNLAPAAVAAHTALRFQVDEPIALALDWTIDISTPRLRPLIPEFAKIVYAEEKTAPTTLENLLQAYVEEEQLTGSNQWRLVDFVVGCVRGAPS
jgi:hypothetical protein